MIMVVTKYESYGQNECSLATFIEAARDGRLDRELISATPSNTDNGIEWIGKNGKVVARSTVKEYP